MKKRDDLNPRRKESAPWRKIDRLYQPLLLAVALTIFAFDGIIRTNLQEGKHPIDDFLTLAKPPHERHFCVPWTTNTDTWWTHAPEWEMGKENDTHHCFRRIRDEEKRNATVELYQIQFHGNCSNVLTKRMWSSGWNADFQNVRDGLKHAMLHKRPVQFAEMPWHYADPAGAKPGKEAYKGIEPACSKGNLVCYFLPISN